MMKKILIIDDEERIAELISFFFLPGGFQSVLKTNAKILPKPTDS
jgi:CheY-like chemotaxis protein